MYLPRGGFVTIGSGMKVLTIGIAGGSGSGKTTVAETIINAVGDGRVVFLTMDNYYKDLAHLPLEKRAENNFDHPSSLDMELFAEHVRDLRAGKDIERPVYDFKTHTRTSQTVRVKSSPVIVLEGILLYENKEVTSLIDVKTFIDTPADLRFIRRLMRDIKERARTPESVVKQYMETVRPMHKAFVQPTRELADIIIPWEGYNKVATEMVISRIEEALK